MGKNDVEKAVAFPMAPNFYFEPEHDRNLNALFKGVKAKPSTYIFESSIIVGAAERHKEILPFLPLDARDSNYEKHLRKLIRNHDIAGLKIHGPGTDSFVSSYQGQISDVAKRYDLPVMVHLDRWELNNVPEEERKRKLLGNPKELVELAKKNPKVRFCGAHLGCFSKVFLDSVRMLRNLWTDCSPIDLLCRMPDYHASDSVIEDYMNPSAALEKVFEHVPDRLMWGSDAPYYRQVKGAYSNQVKILRSLGEERAEKMSVRNTEEFLGLI
jgi:predicted TIM-barrel fold metal-dependent hydrolase